VAEHGEYPSMLLFATSKIVRGEGLMYRSVDDSTGRRLLSQVAELLYVTDQIGEIDRVTLVQGLDCPSCEGLMLLLEPDENAWTCRDCGWREAR